MNEETTITTRATDQPAQDSRLLGVSVRAWLAIMLTATVCAMNLISLWPQLNGAAAFVFKIEEPLYSGWLLSLGFYFGQKNK